MKKPSFIEKTPARAEAQRRVRVYPDWRKTKPDACPFYRQTVVLSELSRLVLQASDISTLEI